MKVEQLINHQEHLRKLASLGLEDAQLVWDLSDAYEEVEKALEKFHKTREQYLKDHGKPDENNPGAYLIEDQKAFNEYVKKLGEVDTKVHFPKIPFTTLKGQKVSVSEMTAWRKLGILEPPKKEKKDAKK